MEPAEQQLIKKQAAEEKEWSKYSSALMARHDCIAAARNHKTLSRSRSMLFIKATKHLVVQKLHENKAKQIHKKTKERFPSDPQKDLHHLVPQKRTRTKSIGF